MDSEDIKARFLLVLLETPGVTPEELFRRAEVKESDGRDVLSSLVDSGVVHVGKGWKLRIAP